MKALYVLFLSLLMVACAKKVYQEDSREVLRENGFATDPISKAWSFYQVQNVHRSYGSVSEALKSLDILPTRERIRFTDTKAEFVHELIWAFNISIDQERGVYQVKNLRPLYVLLEYSGEDQDIQVHSSGQERQLRAEGVKVSDKDPLYMRAFSSLNIVSEDMGKPYFQASASIAAAIAEREPDKGPEMDGQVMYRSECFDGSMHGESITTSSSATIEAFTEACRKGGGCASTCVEPNTYLMPARVLGRYKISSDEDKSRFIKSVKATNSIYDKAQRENEYDKEMGRKDLSPFASARRNALQRDAQYAKSSIEKAVSVE